MDSLALHNIVSRLDLSKDMADTQMPSYENVYEQTLVGDGSMKEKHQEIVKKILKWPRDDNNKVSCMG